MTSPNLVGMKFASRYTVGPRVAGGHFSDVFEATDEDTGDLMAIKVLHPGATPDAIKEFEIEGQLLNRLVPASNVVNIHDTGQHLESVTMKTTGASLDLVIRFHVLELADACLTELLIDLPALSWPDRLDLYRGVVKGAHQTHLGHVLNRDYKSENVLLFSHGKTAEAKVSDYGRGRLMTAPARLSTDDYISGRGDRRFAPPELLFCLADPTPQGWLRAELYLLGSVLYEVATGVGITSTAIPNTLALIQQFSGMGPGKRDLAFLRALPVLRARYELAFLIFEASVPSSIRAEADRLLRGLCDPEPTRRAIAGGSAMQQDGLQWILNRVDILRLTLSHANKQAAALAAKKLQRRERKEQQ